MTTMDMTAIATESGAESFVSELRAQAQRYHAG